MELTLAVLISPSPVVWQEQARIYQGTPPARLEFVRPRRTGRATQESDHRATACLIVPLAPARIVQSSGSVAGSTTPSANDFTGNLHSATV